MITTLRTSAASALSARWLARERPRKLAVCGSGVQALDHIKVLLHEYESIERISIWSRRLEKARDLATTVSGWLKPTQSVTACSNVEDCAKDADLVVTATPSKVPFLMKHHVKVGAHVMAVGACRPNLSELDPDLLNSSQVVVDSYAGGRHESGDIINSQCRLVAELGEVIATGNSFKSNGVTTVYKSLGLAVQDLVSSIMAFRCCEQETEIPFKLISKVELESFASGSTAKPDIDESSSCSAGQMIEFKGRVLSSDDSKFVLLGLGTFNKVENVWVESICMVYSRRDGELLGVIEDWNRALDFSCKVEGIGRNIE